MRKAALKLYVRARIWKDESGQDLIEYVLTVALIAMAATAGMSVVANNINQAFTNIGSKMVQYTS